MKNRPQIAKGGNGNGRESPVDFMRISMEENEENEKSYKNSDEFSEPKHSSIGHYSPLIRCHRPSK